MKKYLYYFSIFVVLAVRQIFADDIKTNEWGMETNNLQMSISIKGGGNEIKTNQPVELLIRYKNISTNETDMVRNFLAVAMDVTYTFEIISPSGKDISPIPPKASRGSGENYLIAPGQIKEFEINLSQFCRFDEIGTYKITVAKKIFSPEKNDWLGVISNPLNIIVSN